MYKNLINKKSKLAVVGLGYVGLPIALEFAKKISVIGFDINEERLALMRKGVDPCGELGGESFCGVRHRVYLFARGAQECVVLYWWRCRLRLTMPIFRI